MIESTADKDNFWYLMYVFMYVCVCVYVYMHI